MKNDRARLFGYCEFLLALWTRGCAGDLAY